MKNKVVCFIFLLSFPFIGISQWISVPSGTVGQFNVVDFIDTNTGYCSTVYPDKETFKTVDGGLTWASISNHGFDDISFFNQMFGFAAKGSYGENLYKTINGGDSWIYLPLQTSYPLNKVSSTSENTAYFSGAAGLLYKTIDGGASFSELNSGTGGHYISDVEFSSTTTGYFSYGSYLRKTTDSGNNWNTIYSVAGEEFKRIYFVNANVGFMIGYKSIYKTTDSGNTWSIDTIDLEPYVRLNDINFYDENYGLVVGDSGTIAYTDNGGESWTLQDSGTNEYLLSVKITSPTTAIVVGTNGTILRNFGPLGMVDNNLNQNFTFFPNPVDNNLTITGIEKIDSIQVFNVLGELLFDDYKVFSKHYTIDFSAFSEGVYFIRMGDVTGNSIVKKAIKK